ncbi:MAG TPA: SulP family inorganic anion transporter [Candidatus Udaeobacter sp.]|nr:SulP family inorganic anion transporter [Candidatus Udaeobacter sp.]
MTLLGLSGKPSQGQQKHLPLLQGLLPFNKSNLSGDVMGGIILAALGIPEVMGYTKIIGTPVVTGLYTMLLPMIAFGIFGCSRHLVVSADSATAAMVAAALSLLSLTAYTPQYVAMTSLVALMAGAMLVVARFLRAGFLGDFLSRTVLVGFLAGVGLQVAVGELHGMLGIGKRGYGFFPQLSSIVQHASEMHLSSVVISLAVLLIVIGSDWISPRFPGALVAVVAMIAASAWYHWSNHGIEVIGTVPGGLPRFELPHVSWSDIGLMMPISFSCFIVVLAQSAATARAYALRYREPFDQNVDLVGLAAANIAAGISGTFVVNGSPTKTEMVDEGGGRSQLAHLTTAMTVLVVLLFLTKPLSYLPNAVLAAIVFLIGIKLIDYRGMANIYRKTPGEFALAAVTTITVVGIGVEQGILLALVLSLLQHVRHSYHPHTALMLRDPTQHWQMDSVGPGKFAEPGLIVYWFGADLFYANAGRFTEQALKLVTESPSVQWLAVECGAITDIDYSAGEALKELHDDLAEISIVLALARVSEHLHKDLERLGLVDVIGSDKIFDSRGACLEAYRAEMSRRNECGIVK